MPRARARRNAGFTLIDVIVVIAIAAFIIAVLIHDDGVLARSARSSRRMQNSTQVRGIHAGLFTFGAGNGNFYPGMNSKGEVKDATVAGRLKLMLDESYFTADYLISPSDSTLEPWRSGPFDELNYSYALPIITERGGRQNEWKATENSQTPSVIDRNTGDPSIGEYGSVHAPIGKGPASWEGHVAWNDNHVTFEQSAERPTRHAPDFFLAEDNLFVAAGVNDAAFIHSDHGYIIPSSLPAYASFDSESRDDHPSMVPILLCGVGIAAAFAGAIALIVWRRGNS